MAVLVQSVLIAVDHLGSGVVIYFLGEHVQGMLAQHDAQINDGYIVLLRLVKLRDDLIIKKSVGAEGYKSDLRLVFNRFTKFVTGSLISLATEYQGQAPVWIDLVLDAREGGEDLALR